MLHRITGISPKIDSCGGLIAQKVNAAYRRVPPSHRRWIDRDDVLQEAFVGAMASEKSFRRKGGSKFSTYLYRQLDWALAKMASGLNREMRDAPIVELDAPLPSGRSIVEVLPSTVSQTSQLPMAGEQLNAAASFLALCRGVGDEGAAALIRGLLFSDSKRPEPKICAEIGLVASNLHIGLGDLRPIAQDENLRKILLQLTARYVMIGIGAEEALRLLQCVECGGKFSLAAVREGRFYVPTMTCRACYQRLEASPASCFGKEHAPGSAECRLHCLDRAVCSNFNKEDKAMTADETSAAEAVEDVDLSDVEDTPKPKKSAKGKKPGKKAPAKKAAKPAKPVKAEKPAKAPKAEKEAVPFTPEAAKAYLSSVVKHINDPEAAVGTIPDAPKELGGWPYRSGSGYNFVFLRLYLGVTADGLKKLEADLEKAGSSVKRLVGCVTRDGARTKIVNGMQVGWKVNEEGGGLKIYDIRRQKA